MRAVFNMDPASDNQLPTALPQQKPGRHFSLNDLPGYSFADTGEDHMLQRPPSRGSSDKGYEQKKTADYASLAGAVYAGHLKALELLLEAGADANSSNALGISVLMLASAGGLPGVVALLLEKGANPNVQDISGRTALMWAAAEGGTPAVVSLLLGAGSDINATDRAGQTALLWACRESRTDLVQILLQSGADPAVADNCGDTALSLAQANGFAELLEEAVRGREGGSACKT